jgi:hypothetical protein
MRPAKPRPAWWAPNGVATIPAAALDPPHCAASPAAPALSSPGSCRNSFGGLRLADRTPVRNGLKLSQVFLTVLSELAHDSRIREELFAHLGYPFAAARSLQRLV